MRKAEILSAALGVLLAVGYDRLTMDAVAAKAQASKATLYRHWDSKGRLIIDAMTQSLTSCELPDTGSLAGDLLALASQAGGLLDQQSITVIGTVVTPLMNDQGFAAELRRAVIDPWISAARVIWDRAAARGELRDDLDLDLIEHVLGGIVLSHVLLTGHTLSAGFVARAIEGVILPCALRQTSASVVDQSSGPRARAEL